MLTQSEVEDLILQRCSSNAVPFAIDSCELSPDKSCWIVRANSAEYLLHGKIEHCYVGVNAYLVDSYTGEIEVVSSGHSVEHHLQDKQDLRLAGQNQYVLHPTLDANNLQQIIHLRQKLGCSLAYARQLARHPGGWLTGKKRVLETAKALLAQEDIATDITLTVNADTAQALTDRDDHWAKLKEILRMTAK